MDLRVPFMAEVLTHAQLWLLIMKGKAGVVPRMNAVLSFTRIRSVLSLREPDLLRLRCTGL